MNTLFIPTDKTNGTFIAPSAMDTPVNLVVFNSLRFLPFGNGFSDAKSGNNLILSFVSALFGWRSPSQITFFVMTVYINSVKAMRWTWFSSDFRKKFFERMETKFNTPSAIVREFMIVGIIAATFSGIVGDKFRTLLSVCLFAVRKICFSRFFSIVATTGASCFAPKALAVDSFNGSASATTQPNITTEFVFIKDADNKPTRKSFAGKIYDFAGCGEWREITKIYFRHYLLQESRFCLGSFGNSRSRSGCFYFNTSC
jgi:hypothetical protein